MARTPVISGPMVAVAVVLGMLAGPAIAAAGGCGTTVYNNYGNAVYTTTTNNLSYTTANVNYAPSTAYVPANYPANFAYPQVAPAAYRAAYREPVYTQPVCAQPVYTQPVRSYPVSTYPVYREPVYVTPRSSAGVRLRIGGSWGHSKSYHHRKVHHRQVHRVRKSGHRSVRVSHRPSAHRRVSSGHRVSPSYRVHRGHHQPRRSHDHFRPHRGSHHRPHRAAGFNSGRRHRH